MRLCLEPGCPTLVPSGRCPAHQRVRYRQIERTRGTATQRGYDADWRKVREQALRRDRGQCVLCKVAGHVTLATEVDHIVPLVDGGARLALANTQSLCRECHQRKTARQNSRRTA